MLSLTRKSGERVCIIVPPGDCVHDREILITVGRSTIGREVRLDFEAPREIVILRTELVEKRSIK